MRHGWKPESGFLPYRWEGYDEALVLYLLGLGSPTHRLPAASYQAWASTYEWRTIYDMPYLHAGPLFTHQLSHLWLALRGIQDAFMRAHGIDYFENSRRATVVQRRYGIMNPGGFAEYGALCWGLTASDGPGEITRVINGVEPQFFGYRARGVPDGPDDGTIAPWAVVASLPFVPEIVLPTVADFQRHEIYGTHPYGFKATFNPILLDPGESANCWVSSWHFGFHSDPTVVMVENYESGLIWRSMRGSPYIAAGLRAAGFNGGWLEVRA